MIRWYFKGTLWLTWNKSKIWNLPFSSLPVSFFLFCVLFVKLLVGTEKEISNIFHYLGMSLRNMDLLRTPSNRISRKLGSKKLPHFHSCKLFFHLLWSIWCTDVSRKDWLIQELERKKAKVLHSVHQWLAEPNGPELNTCSMPTPPPPPMLNKLLLINISSKNSTSYYCA